MIEIILVILIAVIIFFSATRDLGGERIMTALASLCGYRPYPIAANRQQVVWARSIQEADVDNTAYWWGRSLYAKLPKALRIIGGDWR